MLYHLIPCLVSLAVHFVLCLPLWGLCVHVEVSLLACLTSQSCLIMFSFKISFNFSDNVSLLWPGKQIVDEMQSEYWEYLPWNNHHRWLCWEQNSNAIVCFDQSQRLISVDFNTVLALPCSGGKPYYLRAHKNSLFLIVSSQVLGFDNW